MDLAARWREVRLRAIGRGDYFRLTPGLYALYRTVGRLAPTCLRGRLLDAGAGEGAWRPLLAQYGDVVAVDLASAARSEVAGDLKQLPFADEAFDAAFCAQVLEHEREPAAVVAELYRVLRPGAKLLLTAPHLSRLHDLPHDYYRFTDEGLRALAAAAGFDVKTTERAGGLLSFLGHNLFSFGLAVFGPIPVFGGLARAAAKLLSPAGAALDRLLDRRGRFALNWVLEARKGDA
ncbi:MAG: class I SAM-dependent methyltransferase [Candidatus Coatesbacteria bacterium]|nr:MAG: class I SAM-dependent methyltransferase [Candidatus Coatesbacteria bacterium]